MTRLLLDALVCYVCAPVNVTVLEFKNNVNSYLYSVVYLVKNLQHNKPQIAALLAQNLC